MQDLADDALVSVIESRFHDALANGADVRELAAHAVDAVLAECVTLIEIRAAHQGDQRRREAMLACAEMLLGAQFGSPVPARPRR